MLAVVCIICAIVASLLYGFAGEPGGTPAVAASVAGYLVDASIALWVYADATRRRARMPYDFDSLVFFTWPVTAPLYLVRTRGMRGCGICLVVFLIFIAALFFEFVLASRQFAGQ